MININYSHLPFSHHLQQDRQLKRNILKFISHIGCLIPLAIFIGRETARYYFQSDLAGAALSFTGNISVWLLVISLSLTPLNILFGWKSLLPLRKLIGLYSFMYATMHLLIFAGFEMGLNLEVFWQDVRNRPTAQLGLVSFFILLLLALTSFSASMRLLGKWWKSLHRTVYLAVFLALGHWILISQFRSIIAFFALSLTTVLLLIRINKVKRHFAKNRKSTSRNHAPRERISFFT